MITIQVASEQNKPRGVRKATLTKKEALELSLEIDCARQGEERQHLNPPAVEFLFSIRGQLAHRVVRLSKKQRNTTRSILAKAFSNEPVVFLEGQGMTDLARLIRGATGDGRISSDEENAMVKLKPRLIQPSIAVSKRFWRIIEDIRRKTHFDAPDGPPPIDPDGMVENEDPDGFPPDRTEADAESARNWAIIGVNEDKE